MTRKQKHLLARIAIAAILFFAGSLFYLPEYMEAGIFLALPLVRLFTLPVTANMPDVLSLRMKSKQMLQRQSRI